MAKARQFREGGRVRLTLGTWSVEGNVQEDRGPIGVNGRRLYRVEFGNGAGNGEPRPPS